MIDDAIAWSCELAVLYFCYNWTRYPSLTRFIIGVLLGLSYQRFRWQFDITLHISTYVLRGHYRHISLPIMQKFIRLLWYALLTWICSISNLYFDSDIYELHCQRIFLFVPILTPQNTIWHVGVVLCMPAVEPVNQQAETKKIRQSIKMIWKLADYFALFSKLRVSGRSAWPMNCSRVSPSNYPPPDLA